VARLRRAGGKRAEVQEWRWEANLEVDADEVCGDEDTGNASPQSKEDRDPKVDDEVCGEWSADGKTPKCVPAVDSEVGPLDVCACLETITNTRCTSLVCGLWRISRHSYI
jgi:hypothetical protein